MTRALAEKTVLVIGGTGFIGSRLVESLVLDCNARVRVLVRNYSRIARIARFPIEIIGGDAMNRADVQRAMEGCEYVFHSAYGNSGSAEDQRRSTIEGTRVPLDVAAAVGVSRLVYLSTLDVYGMPTNTVLTEKAERRYSKRLYADSKLDAEKIAVEYQKRVPVAILQPTAVYGPFAPVWTIDILNGLKAGRLAMLNDGGGYCNSVYIDDLVRMMIEAAVHPKAAGDTFLISGERPVTWAEYYGHYARMLNTTVPSITPEESAARYRDADRRQHLLPQLKSVFRDVPDVRNRIMQTPEVHSLITTVKPLVPKRRWSAMKAQIATKPAPPDPKAAITGLPPTSIEYYQAKMTVSIEKARTVLGYSPLYDLATGMQLTAAWARWAHFIQ